MEASSTSASNNEYTYIINYMLTYLAMNTMTLRGSDAMVKTNIAKGAPKAIKVQPKNSIIVMIEDYQ